MSEQSGEFQGGDVNAVLRLVRTLSGDGSAQLSILTVALVVACRSCGVDRAVAMTVITEQFDQQFDLVNLDETRTALS